MNWQALAGLSAEQQRLVMATMARRSFRKGDTLFFEGDVGDSLHVLERGKVAVRTSTPMGEIVTLTVLGVGESFGEQALLADDSRRTASVVALEPVETRVLHRVDFERLRASHPSVERFLVDVMAAQVRRLSTLVLEALYLPADRRVVRRIADLAEVYRGSGDAIDIPVRQEDLATMAGTTRQTANQVLKQLEDDGVVTLRRGGVVIVRPDELRRRAG
ncbi:MAG: Crp/Fnr family transcriptional regulator [Acidimicrobiales bacterium]